METKKPLKEAYMKRGLILLVLLTGLVPAASAQSLLSGGYFSNMEFKPTWGIYPEIFHWDQDWGDRVALEGGAGPIRVSYGLHKYGISDFSQPYFHGLGLNLDFKLGPVFIDPGFSVYTAKFDTIIYSPTIAVEWPFLRFGRRGDYLHMLTLRAESNLFFRLHFAAGIDYTRRLLPLPPRMEYVVLYVDLDEDKILSGYEEAGIGVRLNNVSEIKAASCKIKAASINAQGHKIEAWPVEVVNIPAKSYKDTLMIIRSLDGLYNGQAKFTLQFTVVDQSGKTHTGQYTLTVPTKEQDRPTMPPDLAAEVSFEDAGDRDGFLDGGEQDYVVVKVHNKASTRAYNLQVMLSLESPVAGVRFPQTTVIPMMAAEHVQRIPISADRSVQDGQIRLRVDVKEPFFGADADPRILVFETREFEPPALAVVQHGVQEEIIKGDEHSHVSMVVQNNGTGNAQATRVSITLPEGANLVCRENAEWSLGDLAPGEWRRIDLTIFLAKGYATSQLPLKVALSESRAGFRDETTVTMPVGTYVAKVDVTHIKGYEETPSSKGAALPVFTSDVDTLSVKGKDRKPDAIAVIVYIKDYKAQGVPGVAYADRDARVMRKYVTELLGYSDSNVIFLANPTKGELEQVFGLSGQPEGRRLDSWIRPGTTPEVFIYYVGHGAPSKSGKAYIVPSDCAPDAVETGGYSIDVLYDNVVALPISKATVVIDACFSGQTQEGMIVSGASPIMMSKMPESHLRDESKLTIFAAAKGDEFASWYDEQRHSMFTYYFLNGLGGQADVNSDGSITVGEMDAYLTKEIPYIVARKFPGRKQSPDVRGQKDAVLVRYK